MASQRQDETRPQPRLYLVTPKVADTSAIARDLEAALSAGDIAAVLLRLADDAESTLIKRVKAIAPAIQDAGAALLLDNRPDLVARAGADGAHINGIANFETAVASLKPDRIAGAGDLPTRHDAMLAAELGADYVMFGEPTENDRPPSFEQTLERVAWWQEVFQTPCVGFAASLEDVAPLARAGADFVALGAFAFADAQTLQHIVGKAMMQISTMETA